jgi:hypothetical protein
MLPRRFHVLGPDIPTKLQIVGLNKYYFARTLYSPKQGGLMVKYKYAILVAVGSVWLSGCATVMHGAHQTFELGSDPQGATVKLSNGASCVTPCKMELPRRHDLRVDFTLAGFRPVYVLVQSKVGGATFGNILAGGIIGAVVDSSNGASKKLIPNPLNVSLVAIDQAGQEVLIDKKGKETGTVEEHNNKVRLDVAKSIGPEAAGLPAPLPSPAPTGN